MLTGAVEYEQEEDENHIFQTQDSQSKDTCCSARWEEEGSGRGESMGKRDTIVG